MAIGRAYRLAWPMDDTDTGCIAPAVVHRLPRLAVKRFAHLAYNKIK